MGVDGLALALSLSTTAQLLAYVILLQFTVEGGLGLGGLAIDLAKMALATIPAVAVASWLMAQGQWAEGPSLLNAGVFALSGLIGGLIYAGSAMALGIAELRTVASRIRRRKR
jgi:peptidoglycan biosynthesis protein MviN/MurJ (putative lipid II flippase)